MLTFPKKSKKRFLRGYSAAPKRFGGHLLFIHLLNFKKMFKIFLAIALALACAMGGTHKASTQTTTTVTAQDSSLTGGDNGHIPPGP
jgi:hypothetical protein